MGLAVGTYRRIESFLDDCNNYVIGTKLTGDIDEIELLKVTTEINIKPHHFVCLLSYCPLFSV